MLIFQYYLTEAGQQDRERHRVVKKWAGLVSGKEEAGSVGSGHEYLRKGIDTKLRPINLPYMINLMTDTRFLLPIDNLVMKLKESSAENLFYFRYR